MAFGVVATRGRQGAGQQSSNSPRSAFTIRLGRCRNGACCSYRASHSPCPCRRHWLERERERERQRERERERERTYACMHACARTHTHTYAQQNTNEYVCAPQFRCALNHLGEHQERSGTGGREKEDRVGEGEDGGWFWHQARRHSNLRFLGETVLQLLNRCESAVETRRLLLMTVSLLKQVRIYFSRLGMTPNQCFCSVYLPIPSRHVFLFFSGQRGSLLQRY